MEVKSGYKLTEIGVIPEEWDVASLQNVVDFTNGKPHEGNVIPDGRYYLVTLDSIGIDGDLKAEHKQTNVWDCSLKKGDIVAVLSDIAHGNLLGLCDLIPEDNKYVLNQRMGRLRLKVAADPLFIRLQINRRQSHFKKRGQGTSQRHIYQRDFDSLEIPFTSEAEQRAIAEALSDAGALVAGLDRLIAKKRDLKQASMQQLLTGQTRLPGFRREWELRKLGDMTDTDPENLGSDTPPDLSFKYISLEDVDHGILKSHSSQIFRTAPSRARRRLRNNDVLVSTVRPNLKSHLLFRDDSQRWVCSTGFCVVRCREKVSYPAYVFFHMFAHPVARQIEALLTGSNYPAINSREVRALEIPFPNYDEQTAIAEVLSDMDAELAALEQRRDKTRALKQGIMQELLTGRIRLV